MKAKTNLFARQFAYNLKREKLRLVKEAKVLKEDALSDALDNPEVGENAAISDMLGDIEKQAEENKKQELILQQYINRHNAQTNEIIVQWIEKLDEFSKFINDPTNDSSIRSIIDTAVPGSVFEKIKNTEKNQLTKAAQAIATLSESLRSYVIGGQAKENAEAEVKQQQAQPEVKPDETQAEEEEVMTDVGDVDSGIDDSEI